MIEEKLERIATSLEKIADALTGGAIQMPIPFPKPEVEEKAKPTLKPAKEATEEPLAVDSSKELSRAELLAECERLGVEVDKKKSTTAIQKLLDAAKNGSVTKEKEPEVVVEAGVVEAKDDIVKKAEVKAASEKDYELDEVRKVVLDFAKTNGADAVIEIVRKASEGAKKKLVELTQKELNTVVKLVKGE